MFVGLVKDQTVQLGKLIWLFLQIGVPQNGLFEFGSCTATTPNNGILKSRHTRLISLFGVNSSDLDQWEQPTSKSKEAEGRAMRLICHEPTWTGHLVSAWQQLQVV